jgi:hypothetical protein
VALDPTYVFATNLLASENLFVVWLAAGLYATGGSFATEHAARALTTEAPKRTLRQAAMAGLAFALATLTRATGVLLAPVAALWLGRRGQRRAALVCCATFLVAMLPWTLRNARLTGTAAFVCFGAGFNFAIGHAGAPAGHPEAIDALLAAHDSAPELDRKGWAMGLAALRAQPFGFFERGVAKIGQLFAPPVWALHSNSAILLPDARSDPTLAPLAAAKRAQQAVKDRWLHGPWLVLATLHAYVLLVAALVACSFGWRQVPADLRLAAAIAACWVVVSVLFWAQPRFRYPMDVPMALLAGWAFDRWWPRRSSHGRAEHATGNETVPKTGIESTLSSENGSVA